MCKKSLILGSIFLLVGAGTYWWIVAGKRQQDQQNEVSHNFTQTDDYIKQYQEWLQLPPDQRTELPLVLDQYGKDKTNDQLRQEQRARLKADIDKLASGEIAVNPFTDILYGDNWQSEVNEYKKKNEFNEYVLTSSIVCTTMGGSIYAWWVVLWTARRLVRASSNLRHIIAARYGNPEEVEDDEPIISAVKELQQEQQKKKAHEKHNTPEKQLNVSAHPGRQNPVPVKTGFKPAEKLAYTYKGKMSNGAEKINKLFSDEKGTVLETPAPKAPALKTTTKWGKQRSEAEDHSKPINSAINELTEQVSAIREYAACQQDRLEKLQDGYDWNIIKTFCLRVIRCIDNLENRIVRLGEKDARAIHLEEVRDELIFALESSGIEQFEPEIESEYRGQEKFAEAIKDKEKSDDPSHTGKIAQVIRPGYQYFINEENVKVVRPAQVKLFA
jgi:hypothetical protein